MKKITKIILIFSLAIFLTASTAFKGVEVFNKSELNDLSCGWPLQYISSGYETSILDPPYPWKASCLSCGWGDPVDINWRYFIFDTAFFYLLVSLLFYGSNTIAKKIRRKKRHQ